ncbi:MAG: YggT family protein [Clostridia bacterium]|nr:YggT family protein [Clostridia bacterium]
MYQIVYVVSSTVRIIIAALQFLMLARAIISWLPIDEDNPIVTFLYAVTEPVIMPVRAVLDRLGLFEGMPIDMSFFITFILLSVLEMFL